MQIFVNGHGEKAFTPDQVIASITFEHHANTYDEALNGGVEKVKNYINSITEATDLKPENFKTRAYYVQERFNTNTLDPKTEADLSKNLQKRVSDGFFFTQYASIEFDFDNTLLAKLLVNSSKIPNAPQLHVNFALKDIESKKRELISIAFEDAKKKVEALTMAANKNIRDCVRVEIDRVPNASYDGAPIRCRAASGRSAALDSIEQQIKNVDETFKPDDIVMTKDISCIWETAD